MLETGFVSDIILFSHLFQQEEIENFTLTFFNWKKKLPYLLSLALAVDASCCPSHSDDHQHHPGDHSNGRFDDHSDDYQHHPVLFTR